MSFDLAAHLAPGPLFEVVVAAWGDPMDFDEASRCGSRVSVEWIEYRPRVEWLA